MKSFVAVTLCMTALFVICLADNRFRRQYGVLRPEGNTDYNPYGGSQNGAGQVYNPGYNSGNQGYTPSYNQGYNPGYNQGYNPGPYYQNQGYNPNHCRLVGYFGGGGYNFGFGYGNNDNDYQCGNSGGSIGYGR